MSKPINQATEEQKLQMNALAKQLGFAIDTLDYYIPPKLNRKGDLVIQGYWSEDRAFVSFKKTDNGYVATHVQQYYRNNIVFDEDVEFPILKELIDGRL